MNDTNGRVLVLAPDEQLATAILAALREAAPGAQVDVARSVEEAQRIVVHQRPDLFVLDVDAIYDLGQDFLNDLRTSHPNARAIVLTAVHLAQQRERAAGMGAIHFLEKPFPHGDFVTLAEALLQPGGASEERFQGKLSDLHIADIIQLKCMSGATSVLEFTGPRGEKARVFFENGQVRHAIAPRKEGVAAFNEIVGWKGGMISEVTGAAESPRTIDLDWQMLLMDAVRNIDETRHATATAGQNAVAAAPPERRKVLVIDDSAMLLNFVDEILSEANYEVATAANAAEGLRLAGERHPHLVLLDYVLPDMKGDEVLRQLVSNGAIAKVPVVYMSGFGADLPSDPTQSPNIIGSLNKPFTSELLLKTVETYMPKENATPEIANEEPPPQPESGWAPADNPDPLQTWQPPEEPQQDVTAPLTDAGDTATIETAAGGSEEAWWSAAPPAPASFDAPAPSTFDAPLPATSGADGSPDFSGNAGDAAAAFAPLPAAETAEIPVPPGSAYFCGDTSFFSLNWALHTIASQKLTGTLRCFWTREPVELLAREGQLLLATTRDPELYCPEAPITLVHVDAERTAAAREQQRLTGRPLFITLAQEDLIIHEPSVQLVQHYGQKMFAQLWSAPRVRFMFETDQLPEYARDFPGEEDVDHWALSTLRFIQFTELGARANYDPSCIPAYTRDGFDRVQKLRLTVAEAQFASQFNGVRSVAQIAKNLRLDMKFARLSLFRFLSLEIIECWPPQVGVKQEKRGVFGRMFGS